MALQFTMDRFTVEKGVNSWSYQVGRFTDTLNGVANSFLMQGKKKYPNGVPIKTFSPARIAMELGRYCKAMKCQSTDSRIDTLEELYHLCEKAECGFTRKYWWVMGYGKKK